MRKTAVSDETRKNVGRAMKRLRTIADMSQVEFAAMAGIPAGTIALVESETKALPQSAAEKIAAACGCSAGSLQSGEVRALAGGEYTKAIFKDWRTMAPDAEQIDRGAKAVAFKTGLLMRTLAARGRHFWGAVRIEQMLADISSEAGLTQHDVEVVARAAASVTAVSLLVGDVAKNPEHDLYQAVLRCDDMAAPIVGTVETWDSVPVTVDQTKMTSGASRRCTRWSVSIAGGPVGVVEGHRDVVDVAFPGGLLLMEGGGSSGSLASAVSLKKPTSKRTTRKRKG